MERLEEWKNHNAGCRRKILHRIHATRMQHQVQLRANAVGRRKSWARERLGTVAVGAWMGAPTGAARLEVLGTGMDRAGCDGGGGVTVLRAGMVNAGCGGIADGGAPVNGLHGLTGVGDAA